MLHFNRTEQPNTTSLLKPNSLRAPAAMTTQPSTTSFTLVHGQTHVDSIFFPIMMHQLRISIITLFMLFIMGCKSNHDSHNSGIGRNCTFTSFSLLSSTGAEFTFSADEMRALEKVWSPPIMPGSTAIGNELIAKSPKLRYSFVLNDQYTSEILDAYLGELAGTDCLGLTLQADGGGFTADINIRFVPLASVLSPSRRSDLSTLVAAVASTINPTKIEGEKTDSSDGE